MKIGFLAYQIRRLLVRSGPMQAPAIAKALKTHEPNIRRNLAEYMPDAYICRWEFNDRSNRWIAVWDIARKENAPMPNFTPKIDALPKELKTVWQKVNPWPVGTELKLKDKRYVSWDKLIKES